MAQFLRLQKSYIGMVITGGKLVEAGDYALDDKRIAGVDVTALIKNGKGELLGEPDPTPLDKVLDALDPPKGNPEGEPDPKPRLKEELEAMTMAELKQYADSLKGQYTANIRKDELVEVILQSQIHPPVGTPESQGGND